MVIYSIGNTDFSYQLPLTVTGGPMDKTKTTKLKISIVTKNRQPNKIA